MFLLIAVTNAVATIVAKEVKTIWAVIGRGLILGERGEFGEVMMRLKK